MRSRFSILLFAILALLGCSGPSESTTSSSSGGDVDAGVHEYRIDTSEYTVQPGQEITYLCYAVHVPAPAPVITKITPIYGAGVHHLVAWSPIQPENGSVDGAFPCPDLVKATWYPLFTGGVASTPLTMPPGSGMHLLDGQQVMLQLHLLNTTGSPITDRASVIFETSDDPALTPAGFFGTNNQVIDVPPATNGFTVSQTCTVPRAMDVFSLFTHAHTHAVHTRISRGAVDGQSVLFEGPWTFNDQPTVPAMFHLDAGESFTVACSYDNPGATDILYGEKTGNEMCASALYYTPYTAANGPGCVKTMP